MLKKLSLAKEEIPTRASADDALFPVGKWIYSIIVVELSMRAAPDKNRSKRAD